MRQRGRVGDEYITYLDSGRPRDAGSPRTRRLPLHLQHFFQPLVKRSMAAPVSGPASISRFHYVAGTRKSGPATQAPIDGNDLPDIPPLLLM